VTLVVLCGLYGFNCVAAICLFGSSRMQESSKLRAQSGSVNNYADFFTKNEK
jgi:hypothetical protein